MVSNAPCQSHGSAGSGPHRQICNHNHPGINPPRQGRGGVMSKCARAVVRQPPSTYFPWQSTLTTPRIPQVDFDIVAHSRPDGASGGTPLRRLPGKPPPFGTVRPDSVPDPGDQGSTCLRRKTHNKGRGTSSLVGLLVGASAVSQVGLQRGQEPGPGRLPSSVLPQHPWHPHPSARLRPQKPYRD